MEKYFDNYVSGIHSRLDNKIENLEGYISKGAEEIATRTETLEALKAELKALKEVKKRMEIEGPW